MKRFKNIAARVALVLWAVSIPLFASEHSDAALRDFKNAAMKSPKWEALSKLLAATNPYSLKVAGELTGTSKEGVPVSQITVYLEFNYHKELVDNVLYTQTVSEYLNQSAKISTTQAGNLLTGTLFYAGSGAAIKSLSRAEFNDTMFVMQPVTERRVVRQMPVIESLEFAEFLVVKPDAWKKTGAKPAETREVTVKIHIKSKQTKQEIHLGYSALNLAGQANPDVKMEFLETTEIKTEKIPKLNETGIKIPLNKSVELRFKIKIHEKLRSNDPVFMLSFPLYANSKAQIPLQEAVPFEKSGDLTLWIIIIVAGLILVLAIFYLQKSKKSQGGDAAPREKSYMLKAETGALQGYSIELTRSEYTIGRDVDPSSGIKFPDNDKFVSKKHALLQKTATGYDIIDLQSTNGVFINGKKVTHASLQQNDVIEFGDIKIRFRIIE